MDIETQGSEQFVSRQGVSRITRSEVLVLGVVLVFAHHGVTDLLFHHVFDGNQLYQQYGAHAWANLHDAVSVIAPLLLCMATPIRSGLRLGQWKGNRWRILGVCALPVIATAIVYPFTSQPFTGDRIGCWLISPVAHDMLFAGYLYGLMGVAYTGSVGERWRLDKASLLTACLFSLWHLPNFATIAPTFVILQLLYTFVFYNLMLLPRKWSGSVLPVVATHMAVNFVSWMGW